jgi:hypothetical protein
VAGLDVWRIAHTSADALVGDEWRYVYYARNLVHGFFSPHDRVFLWNGPGYPLFLAPFAGLDWLDGARYLNVCWHAATLAYAWWMLRSALPPRLALLGITPLALYVPLNEYVPLLYTETLSVFLLTAWAAHSTTPRASRMHSLAAAAWLAALCLTKVVFGYVTAVFLALAAAIGLWRRSSAWRRHAKQASVALALCLPYLAYTYALTGRLFYWSSAGPNSLYWLSTPYDDEWGDWHSEALVRSDPELRAHHAALFERAGGLVDDPELSEEEVLFNLSTPEAADLFGKEALQNIRARPFHFARNWTANLSRLLTDRPVSVKTIPFWNAYTVCHLVFLSCMAPMIVRARRTRTGPAPEWVPVFAFGLITLGVYSLVSSMARFLIPLVPIVWVGLCCWLVQLECVDEDKTP